MKVEIIFKNCGVAEMWDVEAKRKATFLPPLSLGNRPIHSCNYQLLRGFILFLIMKFGAINGFSTGKDGGSVCVTVSVSDVSETAVIFCHVAAELFLA